MKSSDISSASAKPPPVGTPPSTPTRRQFALDGRSVILDPMRHAVRPDLADVRLADRVFAPHYAAPVPRAVAREVRLRAGRDQQADVITTLQPGERFELLDIVGGDAWGIAINDKLVGYLDVGALAQP